MTTLATSASSSTIALPGPSPAKKSNPFARPTVSHSPSSFKRTSLLPTFDSPINSINPISPFDPLATPADKGINGHATGAASVPKAKTGWRLLWRGGVEIGKDGWRLEGELPATSNVYTRIDLILSRNNILRSTIVPPAYTFDRRTSKSLRCADTANTWHDSLAIPQSSRWGYGPLSLFGEYERKKVSSGEGSGRFA